MSIEVHPAAGVAAQETAPVLEVSGVHVEYRIPGDKLFTKKTVYALTDANLVVEAGETLGIVGESGCGKSTLAKAVVGLQQPTSGEILFNGVSLWKMSQATRRAEFGRNVGMIFQDPSTALNRRMPVRDILTDPLVVHRIGDRASRRRRAAELLELVGLPESAADALPAQLSGGQRQRVAIGRALALGPQLLIADEPTSALDVSVRAQILKLLLDLKRELNLALIFISHDIQTVKRMSDRVATMYLGRIVEEVPATQLPQRVAHPYTAALFSATPSLIEDAKPITLEGPVPSAVNPPSGCPFRTRCWRATDECAVSMPPLTVLSRLPLHQVSCYHQLRD